MKSYPRGYGKPDWSDLVARRDRPIQRVLSGKHDRNLRFEELCGVLRVLGFRERRKGSHRIFWRPDIAEIINLQPLPGGDAKPYQVRQVRSIVEKYELGGADELQN